MVGELWKVLDSIIHMGSLGYGRKLRSTDCAMDTSAFSVRRGEAMKIIDFGVDREIQSYKVKNALKGGGIPTSLSGSQSIHYEGYSLFLF